MTHATDPTVSDAPDPLADIHPSVRPWHRVVTVCGREARRNPASARDYMDESLHRMLDHIAERGLPEGTDPNIVMFASLALAYRQVLRDAHTPAAQLEDGDR